MRKISSHFILTPQGLQPDMVVTVADNGTIIEVSKTTHLDREPGVEFYPGILMPGLHNAHCHLELSHLRGKIPAGKGFAAFVEGMKTAPRDGGEAAAEFWDARMWADGVSSVTDICNGDTTVELKKRSPIRYQSFHEIFGANAKVPENLPENSHEHTNNLTPHSLYSLDRKTFAQIIDRTEGPLSIHFMESEFEHPDPATELVIRIPPDRPVMLVHNCLVTQRDIDIVMTHFSAPVTWVLCPASNRHISGLTPPVDLLRRNGLRISVGTDSLASNDTLSLIHELRLLQSAAALSATSPATSAPVPDQIPLPELLGWVTLPLTPSLTTTGLVLLTGVDPQTQIITQQARTQRIT
ncbi:MAG: amidohydrolase family protein [Alistipes sp.]|jgi:cytosine/adenosine deaminase-related metal-dependent hydrolase|nr:amidohydrolase family protein [Alistipes sp.]